MPEKDGCVKPARGIISPKVPAGASAGPAGPAVMEATRMLARVGNEAPDFEVNGYIKGQGFKPVRLSSYKGQWIVLCFYPGDFTFV